MAIQRALLLIADIGGYTRYMTQHRIDLTHAQEIVTTLLEAVIDSARPLRLAKLEGDAAFFWAPLSDDAQVAQLPDRVRSIFRGFSRRRREIELNRICTCASCTSVGELKLKFVAHSGEVAIHKVKRLTELAGVDVIMVHRMLKNSVPVPEYALMTDAVADRLDPSLRAGARRLVEHFEGLGETSTWYLDLSELRPSTEDVLPAPTWRKWLGLVWFNAKGLPYLVGAKKPCATFRNLLEGKAAAARAAAAVTENPS